MRVDLWVEELTEERRGMLEAARRRMHALGHRDARHSDRRETHSRFDIIAAHAVAAVELGDEKIDLAGVQRLTGEAALHGKVGCLFSAGGFHDDAIAWADRTGFALFLFDRHGEPEPIGRVAADAVARSAASNPAFGTGDLADPVELAAVLAAGLVGGGVGEVDLWFGGAGQVLTFWLDPGDRETPASIVLGLYPGAVGEVAPGLEREWERMDRKLPGGGHETLWVRRCAHANQAPTAIAGDAVAFADAALRACDVGLDRCRVELRPAPERDEVIEHDVHVARQTVLGPLGHGDRMTPVPGDAADFPRIFSTLVERARDHRVAGRADVEGVTEDGEDAWHFIARLGGKGRFSPDRWEIEARLPPKLLEPDEPGGWFRTAKATVGGTSWTLSDGEWRMTVVEDDLEIAAHEAVANVAAAYTLAGEALERTAFRRSSSGD